MPANGTIVIPGAQTKTKQNKTSSLYSTSNPSANDAGSMFKVEELPTTVAPTTSVQASIYYNSLLTSVPASSLDTYSLFLTHQPE